MTLTWPDAVAWVCIITVANVVAETVSRRIWKGSR